MGREASRRRPTVSLEAAGAGAVGEEVDLWEAGEVAFLRSGV